MNDNDLNTLYELLYDYKTELEYVIDENDNNYDKIVAINDAINNAYENCVHDVVIEALSLEAKVLDEEDKRLTEMFLDLTEKQDIKSLIEDIYILFR